MKKTTEDRFIDASVAILRANGWVPAVIGGIQIEQLGPSKFHHRLIIKFTGGKAAPTPRKRGAKRQKEDRK